MEFGEINEEIKKLRDMYLGPLLETNGRITNQLKKMEEDVDKNRAAIEICQREIEELRMAADVGPSAKTTQMTVEDLVKEATLQIKIVNNYLFQSVKKKKGLRGAHLGEVPEVQRDSRTPNDAEILFRTPNNIQTVPRNWFEKKIYIIL